MNDPPQSRGWSSESRREVRAAAAGHVPERRRRGPRPRGPLVEDARRGGRRHGRRGRRRRRRPPRRGPPPVRRL